MTDDLTLHHHVRWDHRGPVGPCAWCGKPTDIMADAPGVGMRLPLHLLCGVAMRNAYRKWRDGQALTDDEAASLRRLLKSGDDA